MKVLRPEIDKLKAKYGSDQQQISMEQMKLFREAGVNPLGGCIPGLLQIPIFFALYSFFNSNVALRGQGFLWADDLSQYDSILDLPFNIPFYGDHVSLFTITAVITSFLISIYSMSMTPDQNNPVLKYMPYFFPIILLFVFNKLPSGLTWYYTVSNIITLALQFVIQNYIIDHDKILAKMEENRKKPKTKSKWQERIDQMQEQQKKNQGLQNKKSK
jgi:YidC/Oxa1 family membrane protein insertase